MTANESIPRSSQVSDIAGIQLEVWSAGQGRPILFLHPGDGFRPSPLVERLAEKYQVIAPSHPGFGGSALPAHFRTADDIAYYYLDFLQARGLEDVILMGVSFGGWIAAEMAIKCTHRLAGLVLVGALGARFSNDPTVREIADLFSVPQYEQARLLHHDGRLQRQDYSALPEEELLRLARNHESFCMYGWSPTLHDPKLAHRLHRIDVPTQLVWGGQDRVVGTAYGQRYAQAIPNAKFTRIDAAGHYVHIEQPDRVLGVVDDFIGGLPPAPGLARRASQS